VSGRVVARALAGILVSALAILLVGQAADIPAAIGRVAGVDVRFLAFPAMVFVLQMWVRSVRWAIVLSAVQPVRISGRMALWPTTAGYLGNTILPVRLGEVVRIVLVARRTPVTATAATASVVIERVIDLLALLTFATAAYGAMGSIGWLPFIGMLALLVIAILGLRATTSVVAWVPKRLPVRVRDVLTRLLEAFGSTGPLAVVSAWAMGLTAWVLDALVMYLCADALGIEISPAAAILISAGGALGAALPAAAAALGTYELGAVAVGALVGIAADEALQIALLGHLVGIVTLLGMGVVGIVLTSVVPGARGSGAREPVAADAPAGSEGHAA
jgi:uncharacterized protein (TIRG00374 family)